jgi:hypothetical protein
MLGTLTVDTHHLSIKENNIYMANRVLRKRAGRMQKHSDDNPWWQTSFI